MPLDMLRVAKARGILLVTFLTSGVYYTSGIRIEKDDVDVRNRYTARKIAMNYLLMREAHTCFFVFRISFVVLFSNHLAI